MQILDFKKANLSMRIPTDQEWDLLMDVTHEDDALSHWNGICSWVNDKENRWLPASLRAVRGYLSARSWYGHYATHQNVSVGFRPAVDLDANTVPSDIEAGEAAVVGTLYMGNAPVRVPQNPTWNGDIADYIPGTKLEMRPALGDPAYQVVAIKVADDVFVADQVLLKLISYENIERALPPIEKRKEPATMFVPYKNQDDAKKAIKDGSFIHFSVRPSAQEVADQLLNHEDSGIHTVVSAEVVEVSWQKEKLGGTKVLADIGGELHMLTLSEIVLWRDMNNC